MFSDTGPPASLPTLAVIIMGVMQETLALPATQDTTHKLVITSNIEPGITYEDALGPFIIGKDLAITCSTNNSKSLSWWEGNKQLPTVVNVEKDTISCNFKVGILQAKDSRRHFTCRELATGTEKSVDLKLTDVVMEIQKDGYPLKNNQTVKVIEGTTFNLKCIVNGSKPSTGTWWEGKTKLPSKRSTSPNAIHNHLALPPARTQDNGRQLTCRARNGQLTKTVVLNVVEGVQGVVLSPATDALTTATSPSKTSSSTNTARPPGTTASHVEGVATSTSVGQRPPVPAAKPSSNTSVTTTSAKLLDSIDMILHDRRLIIAVFASIGVLMIILIIVMLWLIIRVSQRDSSTTQQHSNPREHQSDSSRNCSSAQATRRSFDPLDQPPSSPLLPGPRAVEVGDETASSGGRMSVAMLDDRDHSYYYPDQINNSYYYPRLFINKLSSWVKSSH